MSKKPVFSKKQARLLLDGYTPDCNCEKCKIIFNMLQESLSYNEREEEFVDVKV